MKLKGIILIVLIGFTTFSLNAQKVTKYFEKGKYDKAEKYCSEQEGDFQKECYTELADLYFGVKNYDKASIFYEKSKSYKEGFVKIGDVYFAEKDFTKAFEFYSKVDYDEGIIKIGDYYFDAENNDEALTYYKKISYSDGISKIGDVHFNKSEINTAQDLYELAYENDKIKLNEKYLKIANFFFNNSNLDTAKTYFELCYSSDKKSLSDSYKKIGDEYLNSEKYIKAIEYYEKAFDDDKTTLNTYYEKIANIYFDEFLFEQANELYIKAGLVEKAKECDNNITTQEFVDERDGKSYKWIRYGNNIWMAENLAYKPDNGNYCAPNYDDKNVAKYGYLYDFETSLNVCPTGWHISTYDEWRDMLKIYGIKNSTDNRSEKFKSIDLWKENKHAKKGTNESGFNALPAGVGEWGIYERAVFWTPKGDFEMHHLIVSATNQVSSNSYFSKNNHFSVRCVKD